MAQPFDGGFRRHPDQAMIGLGGVGRLTLGCDTIEACEAVSRRALVDPILPRTAEEPFRAHQKARFLLELSDQGCGFIFACFKASARKIVKDEAAGGPDLRQR